MHRILNSKAQIQIPEQRLICTLRLNLSMDKSNTWDFFNTKAYITVVVELKHKRQDVECDHSYGK